MLPQPILIRHYLQADGAPQQLLLLHEGALLAMSPVLVDVAGAFSDDGRGGLIAAGLAADGRFGYLNAKGDWLVAPELDAARPFSQDGLARYCLGGRWGYLNLQGSVAIAPAYAAAEGFFHGLAAVKVVQDGWRYIDRSGQFAFEGSLFQAGPFAANGLAAARQDQTSKAGYIDRQGRWAIAAQFAEARRFSADGVAPAATRPKLFGLIDAAGNWVLKPRHEDICDFNADGLAFCVDGSGNAYADRGYLNGAGDLVIKKRPYQLSETMHCGIAREGQNTYLSAAGTELDTGKVWWGADFNEHGFAIGRGRADAAAPAWGIVRTDGSFLAAPQGIVEPLTMDDGRFARMAAGTPLLPFLGADGSVAMLDRDARVAFRWRREQGEGGAFAALCDAAGRVLWQGPAGAPLHRPLAFFAAPPDTFLDQLAARDKLIDLAREMLAETADKLLRLATDPTFAGTGEDEDEDEADEDEGHPVCTVRRVFRAYLDEDAYGAYTFLETVRADALAAMHADFMAQLVKEFGASDPAPEHIGSASHFGEDGWAVGMPAALPGTQSGRPEDNRLWLVMRTFSDCGDGDAWYEIWLSCAPTPQALAAALRARAGITGGEPGLAS